MSYFGIKVKHKAYEIQVTIHGPVDTFEVSPFDLELEVLKMLTSYEEATFNMMNVARMLADDVAATYCNGDTLLWAEVDVSSASSKMICGSSVSKADLIS